LNIQIENWGASAVLVFGWSFDSHFKAMRYFKGKIPVFFRGDSHLLDEVAGIKTILRRTWLKFVYRFIDFAFYVGTNNKNYYLRHGLKEKHLIFAPHSIDNERFIDENDDFTVQASNWRKQLGFTEKDVVFLFVGKFEKKKNPFLLMEAAKRFQHNSNLKLLFVGNGELENEMKQNMSENIVFLPFQNQLVMPVIYRLGNVYVLPSSGPGETWGLAVNEAMVCGKPVLVSDKVGCAVDLVQSEKNGYVFKSGNIDDLIEKMSLFNTNNITGFSEKSQEIIKDYSIENIVKAIESAINKSA
jgi:glycosyltransferase involved in cell wall biosynthesis